MKIARWGESVNHGTVVAGLSRPVTDGRSLVPPTATTAQEAAMAKAKSPIPEGFHTVTPQLTLDNASRAIEWYKKAFGAVEVSKALGPDGKVMHADLKIGNSHVMMNDVMGDAKGPKGFGGSPASLWLYVEDADALFRRALDAGAKVPPGPMGQIQDQFWGDRCGMVIDPEGYRWTIATHKEDLTPDEMNQRQEEFFRQFAHA
jgi:PhnB protein